MLMQTRWYDHTPLIRYDGNYGSMRKCRFDLSTIDPTDDCSIDLSTSGSICTVIDLLRNMAAWAAVNIRSHTKPEGFDSRRVRLPIRRNAIGLQAGMFERRPDSANFKHIVS